MKFSTSTLAALSLAAAANAQNASTFATGLLGLLTQSNLTTLASFAATNAATLLPLLQNGGNFTVFAPTDAAFAALGNETLSNAALVGEVILYHIYSGGYPVANLNSANHTIARSQLNATGLVNLPGGQKQVAALISSGTEATVLNSNVTSVVSAVYENLQVYIIDEVLTVPGNLTATAGAAGLSELTGLLTQYAPDVAGQLDAIRGVTLFAPANSAFANAASLLASVGTNTSLIQNVLLNHVLNGTVVYSSQITNGANITSASGETLTFLTNSTGTYVQSAGVSARILQSDVIVANGVVHIIDEILANTASNPSAAASAASSALAAGTSPVTATPTGPVTKAAGSGGSALPTSSKPASGSTVGASLALVASGALAVALMA